MHAALDHVALEHAVGKACRRVRAFVVGDVEGAVNVINRDHIGADREGFHRARRYLGLRANAHHILPIVGHREFLHHMRDENKGNRA